MSPRDHDRVSAWMPLYVADFSLATNALTAQEVGVYIRLLITMWSEGGYLNFNAEQLARIVYLPMDAWHAVWGVISHFFDEFDGRISQKRLLYELDRAREMRNAIAARASAGGHAKEASRRAQALLKQGFSTAKKVLNAASSPSPLPEDQTSREDSASTEMLAHSVAATADPVLVTFPVVRGASGPVEWHFTESALALFREGFPALDLLAETRKALTWVRANPRNRKTARGMPGFLNRWYSRAQDRGGARMGNTARDREARSNEAAAKWERMHGGAHE